MRERPDDLAGPPAVSWPRDIPPLWFLGATVLQILLWWLLPGPRLLAFPWNLAGVGLIAAALVLMLWAVGLFRRAGTGIRPFTDATVLVRRGPYRFTRNPMYLAMVVMQVGIAAALGVTAPWGVVPVFAAVLHLRFIRREEAFLQARFGDDYRELCRHVRRWL